MVILVALFVVQKQGTARSGDVFGPIMLVWFVTIGVLGAVRDRARAARSSARSIPCYALRISSRITASTAFLVLGAVVLAVTGGEALYADMGHFGRRPIRLAWFALVLPALLLNYFGQGALSCATHRGCENPFFCSRRACCSTRWSRSRPWPRSSRRRR